MVEKNKPRILSLDVWDTLLRRTVHPDQIKIFSQQRIAIMSKGEAIFRPNELLALRQNWEKKEAELNKSENLDDEYEISKTLSDNLNLSAEIIKDIVQFEFDLEMQNSYPDPDILETIRHLQSSTDERLIAISDFYFGATHMRDLIARSFPNLRLEEILVSCEVGFNKRNRLFSRLLETREDLTPANWTHVGDSITSDIEGAKRFGITTVHFEPKNEHSKRLEKEKSFQERLLSDKWINKFDINERITLGLIGYSEFLRSEALRLDAKILFLEREGLTLKAIFQRVVTENIFQLPEIAFDSLAISRISIFAAAYSANPHRAVAKVLFSYPDLTGKVFLQSLGVRDFTKYTKLNKKYSEFISDSSNEKFVMEYCSESFSNTKKFLGTIIKDNECYVLADVGWLGSMQEYLSLIYPNVVFHGAYLGLQEFSRLRRIGKAKSYLDPFTSDSKKILRNVRPIEMLFMPEGVSGVIGFSSDGAIIRNAETSHEETPLEFLKMQKEILKLIPEMASLGKSELITIYEMRESLTSGLAQFLREPSIKILKSYLKAQHDETFGIGQRISHANTPGLLRSILTFMSFDLGKIKSLFNQVGWMEASFFAIFKRSPMKIELLILFRVINKMQTYSRYRNGVKKVSKIIISEPSLWYSLYPVFRKSCREIGIKRTIRKSKLLIRNLVSSQTGDRNSVLEQLTPTSIVPTSVIILDDTGQMFKEARNWSARQFIRGSIVLVLDPKALQEFELPTSRVTDILAVNIKSSIIPTIEHKFPDACIHLINAQTADILTQELQTLQLTINTESLVVSKGTTSTVAWIIPTLPIASGGHRGMFRVALEFEKHGFKPVFYVINDSNDEAELKSRFREHYYRNEIQIRAGLPNKFDEDFVVATAHYTLRMAITRTSSAQKVVYFVQDDEALFNPVSSTYFRARETYFEPEVSILASGPWMAKRIETLIGRKVPYFDFPVDRDIYKSFSQDLNRLQDVNDKKQIVFYYKPDAERRMADLGLEVLRIVKTFVSEIRIVSFGSELNPDPRVIDEHYGVLRTIEEISSLYRQSHVGLVFSPTNPSLIPYEMSSCGTVVVDYCESGDETKLLLCETIGIQYSDANAKDLARKVIELLLDKEYFLKSQAKAIALSKNFATPEISGQQAVKLFTDLLSKPGI